MSHSPAPALVSLFLCAILPALHKSSFPGVLSPSVFEPLAAAVVCLGYLRLMACPTPRTVAVLILAAVATAVTTHSFVFLAGVISVSFARAVFSSRVDKVSREKRLAQVTCIMDVMAVTGTVGPSVSGLTLRTTTTDALYGRRCDGSSCLVRVPTCVDTPIVNYFIAAFWLFRGYIPVRSQSRRVLLLQNRCV